MYFLLTGGQEPFLSPTPNPPQQCESRTRTRTEKHPRYYMRKYKGIQARHQTLRETLKSLGNHWMIYKGVLVFYCSKLLQIYWLKTMKVIILQFSKSEV